MIIRVGPKNEMPEISSFKYTEMFLNRVAVDKGWSQEEFYLLFNFVRDSDEDEIMDFYNSIYPFNKSKDHMYLSTKEELAYRIMIYSDVSYARLFQNN